MFFFARKEDKDEWIGALQKQAGEGLLYEENEADLEGSRLVRPSSSASSATAAASAVSTSPPATTTTTSASSGYAAANSNANANSNGLALPGASVAAAITAPPALSSSPLQRSSASLPARPESPKPPGMQYNHMTSLIFIFISRTLYFLLLIDLVCFFNRKRRTTSRSSEAKNFYHTK